MEKEVKITQSLNADTLFKATIHLLISGRVRFYVIFILVIFGINILTTLTNADGIQHDPFDFVTYLIPFIVTILVIIRTRINIKNKIKKNSRYYTNVTFTINNIFFKAEGKDFQNTTEWEGLEKIKETAKWFLIYTNKNHANIIEKSQLDPWQQEELKVFLVLYHQELKYRLSNCFQGQNFKTNLKPETLNKRRWKPYKP